MDQLARSVERFVACVEDEKITRTEKRRRRCVGFERVLHGFASLLCGLLLKETKKMFIGGGEEDEKSGDAIRRKVNSCSYLIKITHV